MAPKVRKAALYPAWTVTNPASVVESAAPTLCAVMIAPCATLKRPVSRIRSETITGKIAEDRAENLGPDAIQELHADQPGGVVGKRV